MEAHVNWYLGADYLSSRCWYIFIKVLWLCEFFLILKLFVICYSFAQLKTHFLHLTILSHLVIFFVEVLTDLKVENIRYCVSDKVSHNVLDCKVIQTKWLLRIATYTLNDCMFKFVAI